MFAYGYLYITIFYGLSLWGPHWVEDTDRMHKGLPSVWGPVWCLGGIQSCLHTVKCRPTQFPVLLMQFTVIARLHGSFIATRLIVRSADMVCSSYIVKHLLKPPLQGVCLSPFACVWHLHGHDCRPSIWIESAAHWRFTTSYERAQRPDICLCGFGETKGRGPRANKPSGRLQRAGKAAGSPRSVLRPQPDFRWEEWCLFYMAGSLRDTLPSKTPLQGQ